MIDTRTDTHTHTDAGNDNTRRPILASGKKPLNVAVKPPLNSLIRSIDVMIIGMCIESLCAQFQDSGDSAIIEIKILENNPKMFISEMQNPQFIIEMTLCAQFPTTIKIIPHVCIHVVFYWSSQCQIDHLRWQRYPTRQALCGCTAHSLSIGINARYLVWGMNRIYSLLRQTE